MLGSLTSMKAANFTFKGSKNDVILVYVAVLLLLVVTYSVIDHVAVSSALFVSAVFQTLYFILTRFQIESRKSVAGLSKRTFLLYAVVIPVRLFVTVRADTYVPADATGRGPYQVMDVLSWFLVIMNLNSFRKYHSTYDTENDTSIYLPLIAGSAVLGFVCPPHFYGIYYLDAVWMTSNYLDAVAMVPQLWMLSKLGGKVDVLTPLPLWISRCLSTGLWLMATWVFHHYYYNEFNNGWYALNVANLLQILMLADFVYLYAKSACRSRRSAMEVYMCHSEIEV